MATFTVDAVRGRARVATLSKSASTILGDAVRSQPATGSYDIFLSHSSKDAEVVLGVKLALEDLGHSVYVDWVEDPQLDRSKATKETARILRERMACCRCLFYAYDPEQRGFQVDALGMRVC